MTKQGMEALAKNMYFLAAESRMIKSKNNMF